MKQYVSLVTASFIGTILGYGVASHSVAAQPATSARLETQELVLVNAAGRPEARLSAKNGGAVLEFYDQAGNTAVELGTERSGSVRLLRFLDPTGRVLAGLNSLPPSGEATLYLGDQRFQARIIIGALRSDGPVTNSPADAIDEWGIQLRKPGSMRPVFSLVTAPAAIPGKWETGMEILKANGKRWVAP